MKYEDTVDLKILPRIHECFLGGEVRGTGHEENETNTFLDERLCHEHTNSFDGLDDRSQSTKLGVCRLKTENCHPSTPFL